MNLVKTLPAIITVLAFESKSLKKHYKFNKKNGLASAAAFLITFALLSIIQIKVNPPMLLLERFFHTMGWLQIILFALYARWITGKMLHPAQSARWRYKIWIFFSIVFFSQLIIGLAGFEKFLMTGKLHIPVPAMIIAAPLYRAERFFMPILFLATVLLVGPAWCSHLCYFGSWDAFSANQVGRPKPLPKWRPFVQIGVLLLIVAVVLILKLTGVPALAAILLGIIFGIIGTAIMIFFSRKTGAMTHCVVYCPVGILANWIGKLNPFRIRIKDGCNDCLACMRVCRYNALNVENIKKRKPAISCTLCGDCITSCKDNWIEYKYFNLKAENARAFFIVLVVSLHAVFLSVARI